MCFFHSPNFLLTEQYLCSSFFEAVHRPLPFSKYRTYFSTRVQGISRDDPIYMQHIVRSSFRFSTTKDKAEIFVVVSLLSKTLLYRGNKRIFMQM